MPALLRWLLRVDDKDNPAGCEGTSFLDVCNSHDENYQKCHSSEDAKEDADVQFYNELMDVCSDETGDCYKECKKWLLGYTYAVGTRLGDNAFEDDQVEACSCCNP